MRSERTRKLVAVIAGVGLLLVAAPAVAASGDATDWQDRREAYPEETDDGEAFDTVREDALHRFLIDHEDELRTTQPMSSNFGEDAGCNAQNSGGWDWAQSGTPDAPCEYQVQSFPIHYTTISCPLDDSCFADALDFGGGSWDFIVVSCEPGSVAIVDWEDHTAYALAGDCSLSVDRDPLTFDEWDSLGTGDWSHTDNVADALRHTLPSVPAVVAACSFVLSSGLCNLVEDAIGDVEDAAWDTCRAVLAQQWCDLAEAAV